MKIVFFTLFCMLGCLGSLAFDTGQQIFRENIKSLSIYNPDNFMAPPVIRMDSHDRLDVTFDIIEDDSEFLRYRLIHCNADWQPSRLMESEYLDGFNYRPIEDFAFSSNTYIRYVNYKISLPDPELPVLVSGNYLLQVYPEFEPENVILQIRFSVSENAAMIFPGATSRTDKGTNTEFQQLFLNIDTAPLSNINPYQDIIISVTQNNRPETSRYIYHPSRVESSKVIYEHIPELIFYAGNEYRRFETVRTDYPGMNVDSVKFVDGIWHAWLKPDSSRLFREYSYDSTQHGRFKIDEYNSSDPDLSADYVMVHFSLDPINQQNGTIYLDGDFTNHRFEESNRLKYDWTDGLFHASLPLKQGSYNYQYVVVPENGVYPSPKYIEGNKYETNNEFLIQVFLRLPGARADRLVGSFLFNP